MAGTWGGHHLVEEGKLVVEQLGQMSQACPAGHSCGEVGVDGFAVGGEVAAQREDNVASPVAPCRLKGQKFTERPVIGLASRISHNLGAAKSCSRHYSRGALSSMHGPMPQHLFKLRPLAACQGKCGTCMM